MGLRIRMEREVRLRMMRLIDVMLEVERRMVLQTALTRWFLESEKISRLLGIEVIFPDDSST
jgi:hypothetical protein